MRVGYKIAIGAAVLIIIVLICLSTCNRSKPDIIATVDSVQYWKNKYGQENASIKQREQDFNRVADGFLDSIASLHNTKEKLLKEVMSWRMKGSVTIPTTLPGEIKYKTDTVAGQCPQIDWVDQDFINAYYRAHARISMNNDFASELSLETFDTLRAVTKIVKEGSLFNRRTYVQVDVVNTNPYSKISGLQVYRQPLPKPKRIGIGLQVGYGFSDNLKPSVFAGVGISFNIIRL